MTAAAGVAGGRRLAETPSVGVVVVNHNGGDLTLRCLRSVLGADWPPEALEVVLVDNGSSDGVARRAEGMAGVTVIEAGHNLGFAGGCNLGIGTLGPVEYVALVNNDATVDAAWLRPLVAALEADAGLGAASPKILFDGAFAEVRVRSPSSGRGFGDRRSIGIAVSGARVEGRDVWRGVQLARGFWGVEHARLDGAPFQWTDGDALVRLPVARTDGTVKDASLRLSAPDRRDVVVDSGDRRALHTVGPEPAWFDVPLGGPFVDVVNNVGSALLVGGYGADRGFLERDEGQYEDATEIFAWCGAAVLLSRRYLETVGLFDEAYFLYYEDFDLSWRGRAQGWRYVYVPGPPVRHVHSASTVEGSRLHHHYTQRNRLLTLTRNAPGRMAATAAAHHVLVTASYARRDVVHPLVHLRQPSFETLRRRGASFGAYLSALPLALVQRTRLRRRQRVPDDELLAWAR